MLYKSNAPDKAKATIMLKLSKNEECNMNEIVEGYKKGDDIFRFILNNFNHKDICYSFGEADIPYKKVMYLIKEMLEIDCLYKIYPALYGEMINDMIDI